MTELAFHCRFCASENPQQGLISIKNTEKMQESVKEKMLIFKNEIVDFSDQKMPENICTECMNSLNKSYKFYMQVKDAQVMLDVIFLEHQNVGQFNSDLVSVVQVKEENNILDSDDYIETEAAPKPVTDSWTSYPWYCSRCQTSVPTMQDLRLHNQEYHGSCLEFQCVDCDVVTVGFDDFVRHVKSHRPGLSNYCQYCDKKLVLPAHIDTHKYNCTSCGHTFKYKALLLAHLQDYKSNVAKNKKRSLKEISKSIKLDLRQNEANSLKTYNNNFPIEIPLPPLYDTKLQRLVTDESENDFKINTEDKESDSNDKKLNIELTVTRIKREISADIDVWSDYPLVCKYCDLNVASWPILKVHCMSHHKKCFGMKCIDCDNDDSVTMEQFAKHVVKHRPHLINSCHICHSRLPESDQLYHIQTHKSHFQCAACGQQFKNMRDFRSHDNKLDPPLLKPPVKRRRMPITDDEVVCNICYFKTKSPWLLRKHKLIHTDRKRDFTCERCGKAFLTKNVLDIHVQMHDLREGEPMEICKICHKAFYTMKRLRFHVKSHNLVMPFQCDDCKKHFRSKESLRGHIIVHMDIKPFACQYCGKRFKTKKHLKMHEHQHTGVRPFSCDICCLNFSCWSNCDKHLRRIHGMSLAKAAVTPYGKMEIDPTTGKPRELSITSDLQEWTKNLIDAKKGRKKKTVGEKLEISKLSEA